MLVDNEKLTGSTSADYLRRISKQEEGKEEKVQEEQYEEEVDANTAPTFCIMDTTGSTNIGTSSIVINIRILKVRRVGRFAHALPLLARGHLYRNCDVSVRKKEGEFRESSRSPSEGSGRCHFLRTRTVG